MIGKTWPVFLFFLFFASNASAGAEALFTEPQTGMEFILVPGGCFAMGDSVGDGDPNERPVHEVCVSDLYVGKYEVTNEQYKKFRPEHNSGQVRGVNLNKDNLPVVNVSWDDAVAYAQWLSTESGETIDCLPRRNGNMPPGQAPHKVISGEIRPKRPATMPMWRMYPPRNNGRAGRLSIATTATRWSPRWGVSRPMNSVSMMF